MTLLYTFTLESIISPPLKLPPILVSEYASNLGEEESSEKITEEQERILDLLDKFQNM